MTRTESNVCGLRFAVCGSFPNPAPGTRNPAPAPGTRNPAPGTPNPRTRGEPPEGAAANIRTANRKPQTANHQRGSVLILVVTVLVLMLLIGLAYVQTARTDRLSTAGVENNIDQVVNAEVARLLQTLKDDLVDSSGNFLNDTGSREPFDYPATGTTYGDRDDAWLASTSVDGATHWPHITNISGQYVASDGSLTPATAGGGAGVDTDLDISANPTTWPWADADNDGITDSKYTNSAVQWISGVRYVTAIRVIDLSALINLNTATVLAGNGSTGVFGSGENGPRGIYTSDVDLLRLFYRANSGAASTELANLMAYRNLSSAMPTPMGINDITIPGYTASGRAWSWFERIRKWGVSDNKLAMGDEMELRYRNGLNNKDILANIEKSNMLGTMLLASATNHASYSNVAGSIADYLNGTSSSGPVKDRTFPDIRHMLTTVSKSVPYAPRVGGLTNKYKYDLRFDDGGPTNNNTTRVTSIGSRLAAIMKIGSPMYLEITDTNTLDQIAAEMALTIQDYSDADSVPTSLDVGGTKYYGLEKLPFLREIYIQAGYADKDVDNVDGDGNDATGTDEWVWKDQSQAMVVEIGNPFDRPIDFATTKVRIEIGGTTYELTGTIGARNDGSTNDILAIYSKPTSPVDESGKGANLVADLDHLKVLNDAGRAVNAGDGKWTFPNDSDVVVKLQVQDAGGIWVTYDKLEVSGLKLPPSVPHTVEQPAAIDKHGQGAAARDGQKLHYLSNGGKALVGGSMRLPAIGDTGYSQGNDQLGLDAKGPTTATIPDNFQMPLPDRPIYSLAELGYMMIFGFNGSATGTLPERLDALAANRRFLNLASAVPATVGIPHAGMIFDQFTTMLNPRNDGVDNDGDGVIDNPEEQAIVGQININTVPLHLATLAAPLPETIDDTEALMRAIAAYRDIPTSDDPTTTSLDETKARPLASTNWTQKKGIREIGELIGVNPGGSSTAYDMLRFGYNSADEFGTLADQYPMPEDISTRNAASSHSLDGPEEALARFQYLTQVFTTRSDVFAAYIYIRGYDVTNAADPFNSNGLAEVARVLVIFDRSGIVDKDGTPRVIGYVRYK